VCPSNAFYEIEDRVVINPDECIDCASCVPVCPIEAIFAEADVPEKWKSCIAMNREKMAEATQISVKKEALGKDKSQCKPGAK